MATLSPRLLAIVDALPLEPGLRVIEVGCGPGAAARAVADRVAPSGHVLAVDRSARAIDQLTAASADLITAGRLTPRHAAAEELELEPGEDAYHLALAVRVGAVDGRHPKAGSLALAVRVGAVDGRHPKAGSLALERLSRALVRGGRLFIDGGDPLCEVTVPSEG